ncbi:SDR family oxidoreductase [Lampropedia puyangensis]|uniref:SDR family oxidoreductase n=1 Tax=Lampropedia puyangensis TaxID=1330072 RepID=A0A4S8FF81_9BURK|nr:SDR family oxidoreductase [Lampropedia puyangensis]THU04532.1 SDR family oxidoreductase [Lampropedia puyangensis]
MTKLQATVITGASAGIGKAIAERLIAQGKQVVNIDYALPNWSHPQVLSLQADLTCAEQTAAAAEQAKQAFDITALVNNAGATRPGTIETASLDDLEHVVGLHLRASMQLVQSFLPTLKACGHGRVVNMASRAALGKVNRLVYATTKAGLIGMTRTLAMELGADGITVNAIAPGPIATELFLKSNPADAPATKKILESVVVGRIGTPDDVAQAVTFFLAPECGFVTGQTLYVCGGATLGLAPS